MLHRGLVNQRLALLADAVCAVIVALNTDASGFATFRTDQHNVRDVERGLKLDAARVDRTALGLDLTLVFGVYIHALHDHTVLVRKYFNHLAAFTLFFNFPADDFNGITFTNLDSHRSLLN
jgi:hypothetical protein